MTIEYNPVFIDSVAFVYWIENHPKYYSKVSEFISKEFAEKKPLITSVIAIAEFCVKPYRENDFSIISDFNSSLENLNIKVLNIELTIAQQTAKLRANYKFLKTADALQVASALSVDCKRFLTNDIQLKKIKELEVILIDEL